jgi:hypothetical protein
MEPTTTAGPVMPKKRIENAIANPYRVHRTRAKKVSSIWLF